MASGSAETRFARGDNRLGAAGDMELREDVTAVLGRGRGGG